jgi:hypothetical protein
VGSGPVTVDGLATGADSSITDVTCTIDGGACAVLGGPYDSTSEPFSISVAAPAEADVLTVCATATDAENDTGTACTLVVFYDPTAGFVTGSGTILSGARAYSQVYGLHRGRPTGTVLRSCRST